MLLAKMLALCLVAPPQPLAATRRRGPPGWLVTNLSTEPESVDPGLVNEATGGVLVDALFAGLLRLDGRSLEPLPDVATAMATAADGRHLRFVLRPSRWSDGVPVTAHDFAFAWRRVLDPATGSRAATAMHVLNRGSAFHAGGVWARCDGIVRPGCDGALGSLLGRHPGAIAAADADDGCLLQPHDAAARAALLARDGERVPGCTAVVRPVAAADVGVRAAADDVLEVTLTAPTPYFPALAARPVFRPVPRHLLARLAAIGVPEAAWTRPEHLVGNGAFLLRQWRFRRDISLTRSPTYWDAARVRLRGATLLQVESAVTALELYRAGEIDWTGPVQPLPASALGQLAAAPDLQRGPMLSVYFYWFNALAPPLDAVGVRRALSLSIDREALVRGVTRNGELATTSLVPDGLAGYRALPPQPFDPAAARAQLAAAGYGPGRPPPAITLIYNANTQHAQVAEAVQAMWQRHLGIEVALASQEWSVYLARLEARDFQVARLGWVGDYADPTTFLEELLRTGGGNNLGGDGDAEVDRLLDAARLARAPAARLALLRAAEARGLARQPLAPLFFSTRAAAVRPEVTGITPNAMDYHPLADISIRDDGPPMATGR